MNILTGTFISIVESEYGDQKSEVQLNGIKGIIECAKIKKSSSKYKKTNIRT
jgi:hypothetical protein